MNMNYIYSATFIISTVTMDRLKESDAISDRMKSLISKPTLEELSLDRQHILFRIVGVVEQDILGIREDWSIYGELSDLMDEIISIQQSLRTRPRYSINIRISPKGISTSNFTIKRGSTLRIFKFSKALMAAIN